MIKTMLMLQVENDFNVDLQAELRRLYECEEMSTNEIATYFSIGKTTSRKWLEWAGVNFRSVSDAKVISFAKMTPKQRIEHTRKAKEEVEALRESGDYIQNTAHLTGPKAVSRRPEVRKKNSEAQRRRKDNKGPSEESLAKMRKSMEKYLRTRASVHEITLMNALYGAGYYPKFQHAECRAVMDFAFVELKIGIEVDGYYHVTRPEKREKDVVRDSELENAGWIMLRYFNEEIVYNLDECIKEIAEIVDANIAIYKEVGAIA